MMRTFAYFLKALEGGTDYQLDNTFVFSKCDTSINSNSQKALRCKNLARHAN